MTAQLTGAEATSLAGSSSAGFVDEDAAATTKPDPPAPAAVAGRRTWIETDLPGRMWILRLGRWVSTASASSRVESPEEYNVKSTVPVANTSPELWIVTVALVGWPESRWIGRPSAKVVARSTFGASIATALGASASAGAVPVPTAVAEAMNW